MCPAPPSSRGCGRRRRRSPSSDPESFPRLFHSETAPPPAARGASSSPPPFLNSSTLATPSHVVVVAAVVFLQFRRVSSLTLWIGRASGTRNTSTRAAKSFSFPLLSLFFAAGRASLRQLTGERRPNPNRNSVVAAAADDDDIHDARGVGRSVPPKSVGPPARYAAAAVRIFLPSFPCLHLNFPRRRWSARPTATARPPVARSFPASRPPARRPSPAFNL